MPKAKTPEEVLESVKDDTPMNQPAKHMISCLERTVGFLDNAEVFHHARTHLKDLYVMHISLTGLIQDMLNHQLSFYEEHASGESVAQVLMDMVPNHTVEEMGVLCRELNIDPTRRIRLAGRN